MFNSPLGKDDWRALRLVAAHGLLRDHPEKGDPDRTHRLFPRCKSLVSRLGWFSPLGKGEPYAEGVPTRGTDAFCRFIIGRYPRTERRQGHRRWGVKEIGRKGSYESNGQRKHSCRYKAREKVKADTQRGAPSHP